jgi:hypothetical protein
VDIEDIDDADERLANKLGQALKTRIGTRMFNRLRDRLEASGVDDRVITLAIITEVCGQIEHGEPVTIATHNTTARLRVEVVNWTCVDELETHGRLLDGPLF